MSVKTYHILHFKYVQFIACKLYLNKAFKNGSKMKVYCMSHLLWKIGLATLYSLHH